MQGTAQIIDINGRPIGRTGRPQNSGLSNGAASLESASLLGWNWWGGSSDDDIVQHLPIVRQRCRDLVLNAPVVAGMINTISTNVVGQGLIPTPTPDVELLGMSSVEADNWKKTVLRYWEDWAESKEADIHRRDNFYELQQLAHRAVLESGDVFAVLPYHTYPGSRSLLDLRVQLIEADCISDPTLSDNGRKQVKGDIYGGVEIGDYGEVVAYHVATRHPLSKRNPIRFNGEPLVREWVRIPAVGPETGRRNILHIMRSQRPGQRRGIPALAPIVESIKMLDRFLKAELQAALVQSLFTAAIKTSVPEASLGEFREMYSQSGDDRQTPSQKFYEENGMIEMGSGTIGFLAPNDDIVPVGVTHPSSGFGPFVDAVLKMIGGALGLPFEMVVMMFSTSFSASRAAMNMASANFKIQRDWMTWDFSQPIYEEFLANVVAKGYIKAPGFFTDPLKRRAYCSAKWAGPADLQIDPQKEYAAYQMAIGLGAMTYSDVAAKTGSDYRQNAAVLHEEQKIYDAQSWDRQPLKASSVPQDAVMNGGKQSADE